MRLLLLILLLTCSAKAVVTTEVLYRFGEDGQAGLPTDPGMPFDSSGNNRVFYDPNFVDLSSGTASPPSGSTKYVQFFLSGLTNSVTNVFSSPPFLSNNTNAGVEAWVRVDDTNLSNCQNVWGTACYDNTGFGIAFSPALGLYGSVGGTQVGASLHPSVGAWNHCALVIDGANAKFYTNGVLAGSALAITPATVSGGFAFGQGFLGALDEARIFSFANGAFSTTNLLNSPTTGAPQICGYLRTTEMQTTTNITAVAGENVTFNVYVSGASPSYYWIKMLPSSRTALLSTASSLTLTNVSYLDAAPYYLIASNSLGMVTSAVHQLTVRSLITPMLGTNVQVTPQSHLTGVKLGVFMHYGIATFIGIGDAGAWPSNYPASTFNPPGFDAAGIVTGVRLSGATFIIFTAKHFDGFCLWPTATDPYNVANSGNTNDILLALSQACASNNIQFGLYYNLTSVHNPAQHTNFLAYWGTVTNQVIELLTRYGPVYQLWIDQDWFYPWRTEELYDLVHRYQPNCLVGFNPAIGFTNTQLGWIPINTVVSNSPFALFAADFATADAGGSAYPSSVQFSNRNLPGSTYYMPFENTITSSSLGNWFYNTNDLATKPLTTLSNVLFTSMASNCPLVVNISIDPTGHMQASQSNVAVQLGAALGLTPVPLPGAPALGFRFSGP